MRTLLVPASRGTGELFLTHVVGERFGFPRGADAPGQGLVESPRSCRYLESGPAPSRG